MLKQPAGIDDNSKKDMKLLSSILSLEPTKLEEVKIALDNQQMQLNGHAFVREIWIGNLPLETTEKALHTHFSLFGEIESVEVFTKGQVFSFLKYWRVESAIDAYEKYHTISLLLNAPKMKVSFADHLRRPNIVGDALNEWKVILNLIQNEELTNIVYVGYTPNTPIPSNEALKRQFNKHGKVKDIIIRQSPIQSTLRSYAYVEYEMMV